MSSFGFEIGKRLFGLIVCGWLACGSAQAATRYVWPSSPTPGSGFTNWTTAAQTIQAAVDAASPGDTVLVTNGVYQTGGAAFDGMSNRVALTKAVNVRSVNGPAVTVIKGQGALGPSAMRCAYLTNGAVLAGFTLSNGFTRTSGAWAASMAGGGVRLDGGGIVSNCVIVGNSAYYHGGGALCEYGGSVRNCVISGNTANGGDNVNGGGGGVFCYYGGTVQECTVTGNRSLDSSGGGINCYLGGTALNCTLSGNAAANNGGGAYCSSTGSVANCEIAGNSATNNGGGVYCSSGGTLADCAIKSNSADRGGGVYCYLGGTLQSCTLSGNAAHFYGGGIYCNEGGTLQSCTLSCNTATNAGGGVTCYNGGVLVNCIVYGNTAYAGYSNWGDTGSGMSYAYCCTWPSRAGTGNITNNPQFVSAATADFRLQTDSPCINAGTNQAWMTAATDLDGRPRILGGAVDMGAYEWSPTITATASAHGKITPDADVWVAMYSNQTFTVTPDTYYHVAEVTVDGVSIGATNRYTFLNVTNNHTITATFEVNFFATVYVATNGSHTFPYTSWGTAATNIQTALDEAASEGTLVRVNNGVYQTGGTTVYGMSNRVALTKAVTVRSVNGPAVTAIRGQGPLGDSAVRCAYVTNGAVLSGFTLTNGFTRTSDDWESCRSGGGVWLDGGGTVSNCTISGCAADFYGGGAFCDLGGTVANCQINGNLSNGGNNVNGGGGGVFCWKGGAVSDCTVAGNSSVDSSGGGINCYLGGTAQNCVVSGNSATNGGGVYCSSGATVDNCEISGNSSTNYGGGAYCNQGGTLQNCTLNGNTSGRGGGAYCYYGGTVQSCTLSGNSALFFGGGAYCLFGGALTNSIVYGNTNAPNPNWCDSGSGMRYGSCCTWPSHTGIGNITNDPQFVSAETADYRLRVGSPCINVGTNQLGMDTATDLDGKPRLIGGTVDIGAYESGYPITTTAGPHGAISPSGSVWVVSGYDQVLTVTPDEYYHVVNVTVDGVSIGATNSYTFLNLTNSHTFAATFAMNFFATVYVATNGMHEFPYTNWVTAATNIQLAVDTAASVGTRVLVSNGVYQTGGRTAYGLGNRIALTQAVTVQSVNGPDVTTIKGQTGYRCAYVTNGAVLAGFTLTNGRTATSGTSTQMSGGGVWMDNGAMVSNCIVSGNGANNAGGGSISIKAGLCRTVPSRATTSIAATIISVRVAVSSAIGAGPCGVA